MKLTAFLLYKIYISKLTWSINSMRLIHWNTGEYQRHTKKTRILILTRTQAGFKVIFLFGFFTLPDLSDFSKNNSVGFSDHLKG